MIPQLHIKQINRSICLIPLAAVVFFVSHTNAQSLKGNDLFFTENKGQIADMEQHFCSDVLFRGETAGADVYIRKAGFSFVLSNANEIMHEIDEQAEAKEQTGLITEEEEQEFKQALYEKQIIKLHRIDIDFVNANLNARTETAERIEGYTNYYLSQCPQGITRVNSYNEVTVKNIYKNIDVKYYGSASLNAGGSRAKGLKYDIIINPGGNPDDIKLKYRGTGGLTINPSAGPGGELRIKNSVHEITEQLPKIYQNINGKIIDIKSEYRLEQLSNSDVIVHFSFSTFNPSFALVVDPWVTYYGGNNTEMTGSVTTDNLGNVLFTGQTYSANFPRSPGAHQTVMGACLNDAFVVKMNSSGVRLWATFYGGSGCEWGTGIATDNLNNVLVSGYTFSTNAIAGATAGNVVHQSTYAAVAGNDAFLVKFDPGGIRLWGTYYGGTDEDKGYDVSTDGSNVYLYGNTKSTTAISTGGSFQPAINSGFCGGSLQSDIFVVKFASNGARVWGTYVGSSCGELCGGITCDLNGDIYIGGRTNGVNFPVSPGAFLTTAPISRGYLFKFNPTGARLWATYYSGMIQCVATDGLGNVVAGGLTSTPAGGTPSPIATSGAFQTTLVNSPGGWDYDIFVVKFNSIGQRLWGTYLGGGATATSINDENCTGIACDANNNVIVSGDTYSIDFPVTSCAYQTTFKGSEDQFITTFDPNGTLICSGYMGLTCTNNANNESVFGDVLGGSIAIDGCSVYMVVMTACGYPVTAGAYQTTCDGSYDIALAKLNINTCGGNAGNLDFNASQTSFCAGQAVNYTSINPVCNSSGSAYSWSFPGGTPNTSTTQNPIGIVYNTPGTYDVKLYTSCDSLKKIAYITVNSCVTCNLAGQFTKGTSNCAGCGCKQWIMINAIGGTSPYSYSWPDGYVNRYKNHLCPGNYIVNITDKNGCSVNLNLSTP
ncbi:MAG: SBBP repeat-containing protein [Bacteroidetes bacterium]|nr:SBBP repeat-containing protein [Bacteroidota bacterium]